MSNATATLGSDGKLILQGRLSFSSVPALWNSCRKLLDSASPDAIDLAQVTQSDSAGLALLIACTRHASKQSRVLRFLNMPEQMHEIARVSNLDDILKL
ncbi:MAG: STAS domain-containing protein [Gammaproteobacteria bacterium]